MAYGTEYLELFAVALLAATVLPGQSEVCSPGMILAEHDHIWLLILFASASTSLGARANGLLGRFIAHFDDCGQLPDRRDQIAKAEGRYQRYGYWSLLS